jgi:putative transposase
MSIIFNQVLIRRAASFSSVHRVIYVDDADPEVFLFDIAHLRDVSPEIHGDVAPTKQLPALAGEKTWAITKDAMPKPHPIVQLLRELDAGSLVPIEYRPPAALGEVKGLPEDSRRRAIWNERTSVCAPFLDPLQLHAIVRARKLGSEVAALSKATGHSRRLVYQWFYRLCRHGFSDESLSPRFDECGAPGVARTYVTKKVGAPSATELAGGVDKQRNVTAAQAAYCRVGYEEFKTPTNSDQDAYDATCKKYFVKGFIQEGNVLRPVLMDEGTYPNFDQFLYHGKRTLSPIVIVKKSTTPLGFLQNRRGLPGVAWQNLRGAGHRYMMDSTVADVYLRHSVNRAWLIGRPVLYVNLDTFSGAVCGFHCALAGPSWDAAKTALFATFWEPALTCGYWGFDAKPLLPLRPLVPYEIEFDRGEYLSAGAEATTKALGVKALHAAAYRPDWKGSVEVIFRIIKDLTIAFVPGAIDARRRELELRTDAIESVLTLPEFCHLVWSLLRQYNYTPSRFDRLTDEMLAAEGVDASPAGIYLWSRTVSGVSCGVHKSDDELIRHLLPRHTATLSARGLHFAGLPYWSPTSQTEDWATIYRHQGSANVDVSIFNVCNKQIWWHNPQTSTHESFFLGEGSRATSGLSFDEWLDAVAYRKLGGAARAHAATQERLDARSKCDEIIKRATAMTKAADEQFEGERPSVRDARQDESTQSPSAPVQEAAPTAPIPTVTEIASDPYREALALALASSNV